MTGFRDRYPRALVLSAIVAVAAASCTYSVSPLRTGDPADGGDQPDAGDAADAPTSPCGDTSDNPLNCGACGHACLGQPCAKGTCVPAVLAANQNEPRAIAVDERAVYWASGAGGGISACLDKTCTGGPRKIANEPSAVFALASTKRYVVWATRGSVGRYPKDPKDVGPDGGDGNIDNGAVNNAVALAADDAFFYFTYVNDVRGGVGRCPIDGCSTVDGAEQLAFDFERPAGLGLGAAGFAFATGLESRSIVYCSPRCDDPPASLAKVVAERQSEPDTIALDDSRAYWTNALAGPGDGVVRASLAEPHAPIALASVATPGPLAVDNAFVYFVGRRDGTIHKVAKAGGPDILLVASQPTTPRAIAVDDKRLYFTNTGPKVSVLWVAK